MKFYNTISPSIHGILSDDNLYFEGICRPSEIYAIADNIEVSHENINILERYFNDIYNLFLRKLSSFATIEYVSDEEKIKLQALLQELIKVKQLIEGNTKNADK